MIAKWFGLTDSQLANVFPNIFRFQPDFSPSTLVARNLDFVDFSV